MATTSMSKEEYLKKYLSGNDVSSKKKKRKLKGTKTISKRLSIIDDDLDNKAFAPDVHDVTEAPFEDEKPQVVGIVDERPEEVQQVEKFRESNRWKTLGEESDQDTNGGNDLSPPRKVRHDSSDQSPPRSKRHDSDDNISPPRKKRHDSDDISPPRRKRHDSDKDISPLRRRKRHDSDGDVSPPRRKRRDSDGDLSPPRRKRRDSGGDLSPPRRKRRDSDGDLSPPRRKRRDSGGDLSPPRRKRRDLDGDLSPPRRKRRDSGGDLATARNHRAEVPKSNKRHRSEALPPVESKPSHSKSSRLDYMNSGAKAGLSNAAILRKENEASRRRENQMFDKMDDSVSGKAAETVYFDKNHKRRDFKMEKLKQREEEAKKEAEAEKYLEWGQGVVQKKKWQENMDDYMHEVSKPLARYKDDKDLDVMLKEKEREGDPMLKFIKKKQSKNAERDGKVKKERPKYSGPPPAPNRYHIAPGYRWDGVDRSSGFEKEWFTRQSNKKAVALDAYKWSVEDM